MAEHIWSVLCRRASIDKETESLSLLDVLESMTLVPHEPIPQDAQVMRFDFPAEVVSLWVRSKGDVPETVQCRVEIAAPDDSRVGGGELTVNLSQASRCRLFFRMTALPLKGPGTYSFVIETRENEGRKWKPVTCVPLELRLGEVSPDRRPVMTTKATVAHPKKRDE